MLLAAGDPSSPPRPPRPRMPERRPTAVRAGGSARSPRTAPRAATASSRCATRRARRRRRGSSTCSPPSATGRSDGGRALPAAGALRRRRRARGDGASRLDFLIEGSAPGPSGSASSRRGSGSGSTARSATPSREPRRAGARRRRGDPRRRRHRDRAAGPAAPPLRRPRRPGPGPARLPRPRRTRGGLDDLFACCEVGLASEDGHAGAPRLRHRPAGGDARGRRRRQRRRLRLRPAADAGGRAGDVRGARRRLRAGAESPMACGFGACFGCAVPTRRRAATCASASTARSAGRGRSPRGVVAEGAAPRRCRSTLCGIELGAPGHQRLGDLRRDRRQAGLRRRAAGAVPVRRLRLEDDHARAPGRKRAAADLGDAGRDDQLDRPPEQGPRGIPGRGPAAAGASCRCR